MFRYLAAASLALSITVAAPVAAKQYTILQPLPADVVANLNVAAVDVTLGSEAAAIMSKHEAKAAEKRAAAKLAPIDASATTTEPVKSDQYATLPFTQMFPLVMQDVTKAWGLTGGRPVKLLVTIDQFKTANAGMAMLLGSADVMTGIVEVQDMADNRNLGRFVVKVANAHSGLAGLAMRGGGIREKLSEEFALESSRVLTGRKSKKIKTKSAAN